MLIYFKNEFVLIMKFDSPSDSSSPFLIRYHNHLPNKLVKESTFSGFGNPNNHIFVQISNLFLRELSYFLKFFIEICLYFF